MTWRDTLPTVRGKLLRDEPLGPYTWFRVGGNADVLFIPADPDDLADFLKALDPAVPVAHPRAVRCSPPGRHPWRLPVRAGSA